MRRIAVYMATVFLGSMALAGETCLNWSNESISEDATARAIRRGPASVSDVINRLQERVDNETIQTIKSVNLSRNNIRLDGAIQLFYYIAQNLPNLEKLDLSLNRIPDERDTPEGAEFRDALVTLLQNPNFQTLDLSLNTFGENWLQYIQNVLPWELYEKIYVSLY